MKKRVVSILSALVLIGATSSAFAADLKVGVVDVRQVLQKSPAMAAATSDLQKQFKPREAKVLEAQKSLQGEIEKLNKTGAKLSLDERNALQDKVIADRTAVQGMAATFQQDLNTAQNQAMQKILTKVSEEIATVAKNNKLDLVLQRDSVPYALPSLDITAQVVQSVLKNG